jgi:hypothetical protein
VFFPVATSQEGGASILLPWPMAICMFFVTLFHVYGRVHGFYRQSDKPGPDDGVQRLSKWEWA